MGPKRDISEERRAQILEAATSVFIQKGFNGASVDDIAARAGLSKGSLYWYFDSKDDIILGILDAMFSREITFYQETSGGKTTAVEKLQYFLDIALEDIVQMEPLLPILFEYWGLIHHKEQIQARFGRYYEEVFGILTPIIQEGVDNGEFHPVDVSKVVAALGAVIEGMFVLWAAVPGMVDLRENITSGVWLIVDGLRTDCADIGPAG